MGKYFPMNTINPAERDYIFSYDDVHKAFLDCIHHKANTEGALTFVRDETKNIIQLTDELNNGTYEIGKSIAFVVKFPVYREVFAADFRDRIVHHLVMRELTPYFEAAFIEESFSCRKGKGVLYGVQTMTKHLRDCTENYTKDAWVLKLDLKSFFMSIRKTLLADMIDDFIVKSYPDNYKKERIRELCRQIIMHHPEDNCERRGDINLWDFLEPSKSLFHVGNENGLPIGNLSSQIFANYFLTPLDKYIKYELGFKHYGRYVDDFAIIDPDKEKLKRAIPLIEEFCRTRLGIRLHPDKRYLQYYDHGFKFTGSVIKPNRTYIINRTIGTLITKLKTRFAEPSKDMLDEFVMTVNSYLGFMRHCNTYDIRKWLFNESGLFTKWYKYVKVVDDYRKIADIEKERAKRRRQAKRRRMKQKAARCRHEKLMRKTQGNVSNPPLFTTCSEDANTPLVSNP